MGDREDSVSSKMLSSFLRVEKYALLLLCKLHPLALAATAQRIGNPKQDTVPVPHDSSCDKLRNQYFELILAVLEQTDIGCLLLKGKTMKHT